MISNNLIRLLVVAGLFLLLAVAKPFVIVRAGTVGVVALHHNRAFVGIELNPDYVAMARDRIVGKEPLFRTPLDIVEQTE